MQEQNKRSLELYPPDILPTLYAYLPIETIFATLTLVSNNLLEKTALIKDNQEYLKNRYQNQFPKPYREIPDKEAVKDWHKKYLETEKSVYEGIPQYIREAFFCLKQNDALEPYEKSESGQSVVFYDYDMGITSFFTKSIEEIDTLGFIRVLLKPKSSLSFKLTLENLKNASYQNKLLKKLNLTLKSLELKTTENDSLLTLAHDLNNQQALDLFYQWIKKYVTGKSLVYYAVYCRQSIEEIEQQLLKEYGENNFNPLINTLGEKPPEKKKRGPQAYNPNQLPLLHFAVKSGHLPLIKHLVEVKEIDPNLAYYDVSPFAMALEEGHVDAAKYLREKREIEAGIDKNRYVSQLRRAIQYGHISIVAYFFSGEAHIDFSKFTQSDLEFFLKTAIHNNHKEMVACLFEAEIFRQNAQQYGVFALREAVTNGILDIVKYLAEEKNISIERNENKEESLLCTAIKRGHPHIVKYFLTQNVNIETKDKEGHKPFDIVLKTNQLDIIQCFIETKKIELDIKLFDKIIDIIKKNYQEYRSAQKKLESIKNKKSNKYKTALKTEENAKKEYDEIMIPYKAIIAYMIENKLEINTKISFLCLTASYGSPEIIEYLLKKEIPIEEKNTNGETPLYLAAYHGNYDAAEVLFKGKAKKKRRLTDQKTTCLHAAIMGGNQKVIELILPLTSKSKNKKISAAVTKQDKDDLTPIHYAIKYLPTKLAKWFLGKVDKNDLIKYDILHFAIKERKLEIVQYLLIKKKIDPNSLSNENLTPLFSAAKSKSFEILKYLIGDFEVDINAEDSNGVSLLEAAYDVEDNDEIVDYLIEKGMRVTPQENQAVLSKATLRLHALIEENKKTDQLDTLLCVGANINSVVKGCTPLGMAIKNNDPEMICFLLANGADPNQPYQIGDRWTQPYIEIIITQKENILESQGFKKVFQNKPIIIDITNNNLAQFEKTLYQIPNFQKIQTLIEYTLAQNNDVLLTFFFSKAFEKGAIDTLKNLMTIKTIKKEMLKTLYFLVQEDQDLFSQMMDKNDKLRNLFFHLAIEHNDLKFIQKYHSKVDVNAKYLYQKIITGNTAPILRYANALYQAARLGHVDIVEYLLSIDIVDPNNPVISNQAHPYQTPLAIALSNNPISDNHINVAKMLLQHEKIDPSLYSFGGAVPIILAARTGKLLLVQLVAEKKVDLNATQGGTAETALAVAVDRKYNDIVDYLLENGAKVNYLCLTGYSPLYIAVNARDTRNVEVLLNYGADPNWYNHFKDDNVLLCALCSGNIPIIAMLLEKKAQLIISDALPLALEFIADNEEILNLLAEKGPESQAYFQEDTFTPLGVCFMNTGFKKNSIKIFSFLLAKNPSAINFLDHQGDTLLGIAVEKNCPEIVKFLLAHGANPHTENNAGISPYKKAEGNSEILALFDQHNIQQVHSNSSSLNQPQISSTVQQTAPSTVAPAAAFFGSAPTLNPANTSTVNNNKQNDASGQKRDLKRDSTDEDQPPRTKYREDEDHDEKELPKLGL